MRGTLEVQREVENEHNLRAVCLLISRPFSVPVWDVICTLLLRMRLFARDKARKETCAYEKMCAYSKGALNNPSLLYLEASCMRLLWRQFPAKIIRRFCEKICVQH